MRHHGQIRSPSRRTDPMHTAPGRGGPGGGWAAWVAALAALLLGAGGCQAPRAQAAQPVAVRLPARVVDQVERAQSAFIDALGGIATQYDRAVCADDPRTGAHAYGRQALAEANLEVAQALAAARGLAQARGGGPPAREQTARIVYIEESRIPDNPHGTWTCSQADDEPACVRATANYVAQQVYRVYVAGYDLNPVTVGNVLEAFAQDMRWAEPYLSRARTRTAGYRAIEEACQAGESPLAQFFEAAEGVEKVRLRTQLRLVRDEFTGEQDTVCAALPHFYDQVVNELGTSLARRTRTQYCAIEPWEAVP